MGAVAQASLSPPHELRRRAWRWHFIAAFLVIPFVLWQSVTGTIYLWSDSWVDVRHPDLRFVKPAPLQAPLDAQVQAARVAHPDASIASVKVSGNRRRSTLIMLTNPDGSPVAHFVDPYCGHSLGSLQGAQWPTGWSRKLHGGWPLGEAGSWLLELGACWTIVMVLSGVYLWWPKDRREFWRALVPRLDKGRWAFWRDLHACVAVWLSLVLVLFLFSALPWTSFWGEKVLQPLERITGQQAPDEAGFAPVYSNSSATGGIASLQTMLAQSRARGLEGDLVFYMVDGPPGSAVSVRNRQSRVWQQSYLLFDREDASVVGQADWKDFPLVARTVATGVSIHEGDFFGRIGPWLNTLFAIVLVWTSISGLMAWWSRKPTSALGMPPGSRQPWPVWLKVVALILFAVLPLLALSAALIWLAERIWLFLSPQRGR